MLNNVTTITKREIQKVEKVDDGLQFSGDYIVTCRETTYKMTLKGAFWWRKTDTEVVADNVDKYRGSIAWYTYPDGEYVSGSDWLCEAVRAWRWRREERIAARKALHTLAETQL